MRSTLRNLLLVGAATLTTQPIWGQTPAPRQEFNLAVTSLSQRSNITPGNTFWRQGAAVDASAEIYHGLGVAVNVGGATASNIVGTGIDLNTITFAAGPRYTWHRKEGRFSTFGEALFGVSHAWNSVFPQSGGAASSANSFAFELGGGVDVKVGKRFAVRPIQADWVRTQFPNATTNVQNDLKLGAGVVLRFSR